MQGTQEIWAQPLGQEDPREQEPALLVLVLATHSSTLAWKVPGTEETGGFQSMGGSTASDTTKQVSTMPASDPSCHLSSTKSRDLAG